MAQSPFFSIIIPVYNGEKYIEETLLSIVNQTCQDFELIVIDGQSSDNTLGIAKKYSSRIARIISEPDKGMYDALNKGFSFAVGRIFSYLNADDTLVPNALELVKNEFSKSDLDLVFGAVNYISESGSLIYSYKALNLDSKAIKALHRVPFAQQSAFWTQTAYKKVGGFDSELKYVADSKFFITMYLDPIVKKSCISHVLGQFRMHSDSFSIGSKFKMQAESQEMRSKLPLSNNRLLKWYYEALLKLINIRDVYKKHTYKGASL